MAEEYVAPKYPRISFEEDARRKLTKKDIAELKSLHKQGWSFKRLGHYFGVSAPAAHYHADPDWARGVNQKRYKLIKKQLSEMSPEEKKQRYYDQNQRFLERTKTDPAAKEFKAKHTYRWKKKRYYTDPAFAEKTKKQAREAYHRNKELK